MLIMFRVKNFQSFHQEAILDMRATGYKEHPTHCAMAGELKVLKTLALYGANASGKSTLVEAMRQFESFVLGHLFASPQEDEENEKARQANRLTPFAFSSAEGESTEMEIVFYSLGHLYQYGFEYDQQTRDIAAEWLLYDQKTVYEISGDRMETGVPYRQELRVLPRKRRDRLYLSVLDYFSHGELSHLVGQIKDYFTEQLFPNPRNQFQMMTVSFNRGAGICGRLLADEAFRRRVVDCVRKIDVGIQDLTVDYVLQGTDQEQRVPVVKAVHQVFDDQGRPAGLKEMPLVSESDGTLRFLTLIQSILTVLEKGGVCVIDEMSLSLHPLLTRFIVEIFQSPDNALGAQLIFTTHDTSLLSKELFRRDELGFIEKNERGESRLFTLADLKIRSDATYAKDYFNGRYGAIPIFADLAKEGGGPS